MTVAQLLQAAGEAAAGFHLLRPQWLWGLLALPLLSMAWLFGRRRAAAWRRHVDAHLLPHLLVPGGTVGSWLLLLALLLGSALAVLAMAGPSWREDAQPLFRAHTPLVIALDLSSSTNAGDLPPSRLLQARAKLATLLKQRVGGDVALLAFAGDSFTVAPLTADTGNVALFLDALAPEVMPQDGKRADRAIEAAVTLLGQAGFADGDVLLISDSADGAARNAASRAAAHGYHISALGLGTAAGAPYRDAAGAISQARLDEAALQALAAAGGGRYARLSRDDADLRALGVLDARVRDARATDDSGGRSWRDEGYWLLPPVMLLALLAFRRRPAALAMMAMVLLPLAAPLQAQERGDWWQRADQQRQQRIASGVEAYRKGDYAAAGKAFDGIETDEGQYNLGNALARQGQYDAAIAAYDRALAQHPGMADAVANRAAVDAARRRQQQGGGKGQGKGQGKDQQGQNPQGQRGQDRDHPQPPDQPPQDGGAKQPPADDAQRAQDPAQGEQGQRKPGDTASPPQAPKAEDARAQQQADQAQQQRMQQALQQQQQQGQATPQAQAAAETSQQREQRQATDAWLRRVPDDPGSLLRTKFRLEYERRQREGR